MILFNQQIEIIFMNFSQGDLIWYEKVELKENYTKWN